MGRVNATDMHPVLVVDFGAQYAQLIARRVREANVYSEIVPHTMSVADMLAKEPAAIILSGGPSSVYVLGLAWMIPFAHMTLEQGLMKGFVPFIVGDLLKAAVAAGLFPVLRSLFR